MSEWKAANAIAHTFPASLKPWLLYADSMTQRMKAIAKAYRIDVIKENWLAPDKDIQLALGINADVSVWFRQVKIYCDKALVMQADSYFTKAIMDKFDIATLGAKPLGEIIFSHPNLQRSEFEYAYSEVWKRQSVLCVDNASLLLRESFIPSSLYGHDYS